MTDQPTKLQQAARAMIESDIDQGHATREQAEQQWGRYEVLAGVAFETLRKPTTEMLKAAWADALAEDAAGVWRAMIGEVLK